jgi:type I restriction-modification system DNA methylase subunit
MTADAAQQLINPSGIARLAGVAPSTVSNWRTRDEDFPRPENENVARPLFSVAKVTAWLESKNIEAAPRSQAFILADSIRGTVPPDRFLEVLLPLLCAERWARDSGGSLMDMTISSSEIHANGGTYDASLVVAAAARDMAPSNKFVTSAIDRSLELLRQEWGDSPKLEHVCKIISEVVDLSQASDELIEATARNAKSPLNVHSAPRAFARFLDGILPSGGTTFADLACGFGQTLLAASETRPEIRLAGNDVNHSALEVAACRLFLRDRSADLDVADLLQSAPRSAYDRVVLHPPFGLRISDTQMARPWPFGAPLKGQSDLLWPQAAYQELADNGYAAVVLPTAALSRGGKARDVWARMISKGAIEAIISLPGNTQLNTALPVSVLILCANPSPRGVLMMQLPDTGVFSNKRTNTTDENQWEAYKSVIQNLSAWRDGGSGATGISVEVPREKLLSPDAVPTPQSWLAALSPLSEDRVEQVAEKVRQVATAWEEAVRGWDLPPSARTLTPQTAEAVPLRPISELALCIPRGTYSKPKESESEDSAPPLKVYTLSSLRSGKAEILPGHSTRGTKSVTTEPGDILVANVGRSIITLVCKEEGAEVDRNLGLVRPAKNVWDADFLAQQLMADHNQAMLSGVTVQRVDIRHLLVPALPLEEQEAAGNIIRQFMQFTERAKAASEQADQYISALRNALASGSFAIAERD